MKPLKLCSVSHGSATGGGKGKDLGPDTDNARISRSAMVELGPSTELVYPEQEPVTEVQTQMRSQKE